MPRLGFLFFLILIAFVAIFAASNITMVPVRLWPLPHSLALPLGGLLVGIAGIFFLLGRWSKITTSMHHALNHREEKLRLQRLEEENARLRERLARAGHVPDMLPQR